MYGIPHKDLKTILQLKDLVLPQLEAACIVSPEYKDKPQPLRFDIWFKKDKDKAAYGTEAAGEKFIAQSVVFREGTVEGSFSGSSSKDFVEAMGNLWLMVITRVGAHGPGSRAVVKLGV